jgi:hypothetical protein
MERCCGLLCEALRYATFGGSFSAAAHAALQGPPAEPADAVAERVGGRAGIGAQGAASAHTLLGGS